MTLALCAPGWADEVLKQEAPASTAAGEGKQLMNRIDFGNAYVMGQSIKSGAVYLLNRKKSEIKSLIEPRKNFRKEIMDDAEVLDLKKQ